jgi:hypothetical protein
MSQEASHLPSIYQIPEFSRLVPARRDKEITIKGNRDRKDGEFVTLLDHGFESLSFCKMDEKEEKAVRYH